MKFEEQIKDVQVVVDRTPRVYIKWKNTEGGRDTNDCYERIVTTGVVVYVNTNNRNLSVMADHPFWNELEKIYNTHPVILNNN